ncbi:mammalian cell entry protein [Mycobacterium sp.]|uniref:mammalian cell entry protein n=1 Tax=Mycobacterium sp. TaxID=1785 RepID=UPI0025DB6270|nr:mammalian cell entry protein [Mycobacterium sp.]
MAKHADAAERAMNGSTAVLLQPGAPVPEFDDNHGPVEEEVGAAAATQGECEGEEQAQAAESADGSNACAPEPNQGVRLALVVGLVTVLALGGVAGWFGYDVYQNHQQDKTRSLFLAVGKQGALNLTTINYTEADADVQRILESSTGQFYDDFSKRAPAFVDVVKEAQAKTDGKITEAGLESVNANSARVLVAMLVNTTNKGVSDQQPRHWRMRIDVQKVGDTVKVANVGFVP